LGSRNGRKKNLTGFDARPKLGEKITTNELHTVLGDNGPALQPYRKRLIDAGIIESPRRGELVFSVPYLSDFIRETEGSI